ncbi:hypothetical protein HG531_014127, partial [Fusarium graminearum]
PDAALDSSAVGRSATHPSWTGSPLLQRAAGDLSWPCRHPLRLSASSHRRKIVGAGDEGDRGNTPQKSSVQKRVKNSSKATEVEATTTAGMTESRMRLEPTGNHEGIRITEPNSYPNLNVPCLPPTAATAAPQETADVIHVSTSPEPEPEVELEAEPKLAGQGGQSTQLDASSTLPRDSEVTDQIVQWGNQAETADSIPIRPPRPSASTTRDDKEDANTGGHANSGVDILYAILNDPPAAPATITPISRPSLSPSPTSLLAVEDDGGNLDPPTHSIKERADHIASTLPPLSSILEPRPALGPESWAPFLSEKPSAKLSFAKTEAELPADRSITITRWWDIDSIWLGIRSLDALQPHAGVFSLSFLPSPKLNISSDQIIQPHGIHLAKTKHLQLGSFRTPYVRFTIFLFFPNATVSQGAAAAPNTISTALSDERLQELYDQIIIPAAFEASVAPCVQELPTSFNTAKRKSHCYQERPGTDRWQANDSSRANHLQYPFPAQDLAAFSRLLVEKADAVTVRSRRTDSDFSYFASPKLVLQSHDLKNAFEGATLEGVIDQLGRNVLSCFRPEQLDLESFWLDIGCRDYPATPAYASQPLTLLWKEPEHKRRHRELVNITRELCRESHLPWPTYFQSYLLHQSGTYASKAPLPSTSSPSAHSQRLCIPRAKAYNCNKELFATMHSDYQLFGAPSLPLLALPQELIDQLRQANQKGHRAAENRQKRGQILHAWNTCKAHVNAAQSSRQVSHYGVRREVTFRLDGILYLWKTNAFRPEDPWRMSCGPVAKSFQPSDLASNRLPFWVLPTKHVNQLIVTNAARFIRPLDYLFHEATNSPAMPLATDPDDNRDAQSGQLPDRMDLDRPDPAEPADLLQQDPCRKASLLISLYTAKLLMRLLVLSLTSEARYSFDRWIWEAEWRARPGSQETQDGMVWLAPHHINWITGQLTLEVLLNIYMERNPLQAELATPSTITLLATGNIAAERYIHQQLAAIPQGRESTADLHLSQLQPTRGINTLQYSLDFNTAVAASPPSAAIQARIIRSLTSAFHEIARAYNIYILVKLESQWSLLQKKGQGQGQGATQRSHPLPPIAKLHWLIRRAKQPESYIPTAYDIELAFIEAFGLYYPTQEQREREAGEEELYSDSDDDDDNDLIRGATIRSGGRPPRRPQLPYWMTSRTNKPPLQDSWSLFVFDRLFKSADSEQGRSPPSWNNLDFLILYRRYKTLFQSTLSRYSVDFDVEMRRRIGYFIRLTFEGDVTKPVTFSKQQKYTKLPHFFRIKMFAPYFYNPAQNRKIKPTQRRGLSPVTAAYNLSDQAVSLPTPQELCTFAQSLTEPELLQLGAQLAVNRKEWRSICRQASSADREEAKRLIATDYSRNYRDLAQRVDRFTKLVSSWQGQ